MAEPREPQYDVIQGPLAITAVAGSNSAEIVWVGKYSHENQCGLWVESISKYSEIVTWEAFPCGTEDGEVQYELTWHNQTITGTITVKAEPCPCDYVLFWEDIRFISGGPLETVLQPDDTELHIEYTLRWTKQYTASTCPSKVVTTEITDGYIQAVEPLPECTGTTPVTGAPVSWNLKESDIDEKYHDIFYPITSTTSGQVAVNPRSCCEAAEPATCIGIDNIILYTKDGDRFVTATTTFPSSVEKIYISYDQLSVVTTCTGDKVTIQERVEKEEHEIGPNTTDQDIEKTLEIGDGCGKITYIIKAPEPEPVVTTQIEYTLVNKIYASFECEPELDSQSAVYDIVSDTSEDKQINLKYLLLKKVVKTLVDNVQTSVASSDCTHKRQEGESFLITLTDNTEQSITTYSLNVNITLYFKQPDNDTKYGNYVWYQGGKILGTDIGSIKEILDGYTENCDGISKNDYDAFETSFYDGSVSHIISAFFNAVSEKRWYQEVQDDGKINIISAFTQQEFTSYIDEHGTEDEDGNKFITLGGQKYYESDFERLTKYDHPMGPEWFIDKQAVVGRIYPISQKPCDTDPEDSEQICSERVYLRLNGNNPVFVRERFEASQDNIFRCVDLTFSEANEEGVPVYYPEEKPREQFTGCSFILHDDQCIEEGKIGDENPTTGVCTGTYPVIPWEIVRVNPDCSEVIVQSGTTTGQQDFHVSVICSNDKYIPYYATQIFSATTDGHNYGWAPTIPTASDVLYEELTFTLEAELFGECIEETPCGGKIAAICFKDGELSVGTQENPIDGCDTTATLPVPITMWSMIPSEDDAEDCTPSEESRDGVIQGQITLNPEEGNCQDDKYQITFTAMGDEDLDKGEIVGNVTGTKFTGSMSTYEFYTDTPECRSFTVTVYQQCDCTGNCKVQVTVTPAISGIVVTFNDAKSTTGITNEEGKVEFTKGEETTTEATLRVGGEGPIVATIVAGSTFEKGSLELNNCDEYVYLAKWAGVTGDIECDVPLTLRLTIDPVTATPGCWTQTHKQGDIVQLQTKEYPITLTLPEGQASLVQTGTTVTFIKDAPCSYDNTDVVKVTQSDSTTKDVQVTWKEKEMTVTASPDTIPMEESDITLTYKACESVVSETLYVHVVPDKTAIPSSGETIDIRYFASTSEDPNDTTAIRRAALTLSHDGNNYVIINEPSSITGNGVYTQSVTFSPNGGDEGIDITFTSTMEDGTTGTCRVRLLSALELPPSDYFVFTYTWTDDDGADLDSLTVIRTDKVQSKVGDTYLCKNQVLTAPLSKLGVGFNGPIGANITRQLPVLNEEGEIVPDTYYLQHGGDNTTSGTEGAMICWNNLIKYGGLGANDTITVDIYANWFGSRNNGNMGLNFTAYKGNGQPSYEEMELIEDEYRFKPKDGANVTTVTADTKPNLNVKAKGSRINPLFVTNRYIEHIDKFYSKIATLNYNIKSQTTKLVAYQNTDGLVENIFMGVYIAQVTQDETGKVSYTKIPSDLTHVSSAGGTVELGDLCIVTQWGNGSDNMESYSIYGLKDGSDKGCLSFLLPWNNNGEPVTNSDDITQYTILSAKTDGGSQPIINNNEFKYYATPKTIGGVKCLNVKLEIPANSGAARKFQMRAASWVKYKKPTDGGAYEDIVFLNQPHNVPIEVPDRANYEWFVIKGLTILIEQDKGN